MSTKITEGQMDFFGLLNEYTDETGATVRVKDLTKDKKKPKPEEKPVSEKEPEMEQLTLDFSDIEVDYNKLKVDLFVEDLDAEFEKEKEEASKPVTECVAKPVTECAAKPISERATRVELFKGCKKCWCADCKHNEQLEGVPRDFGGMSMACTPCDDCEKEGLANTCPIGDYKEGCKLRAKEEGVFIEESMEE